MLQVASHLTPTASQIVSPWGVFISRSLSQRASNSRNFLAASSRALANSLFSNSFIFYITLNRRGCKYFPPCPTRTSPLLTSRSLDQSRATFSSTSWSSKALEMMRILSSWRVERIRSRVQLRRSLEGLECFGSERSLSQTRNHFGVSALCGELLLV